MSDRDHIDAVKAAAVADLDGLAAALGLRRGLGGRYFCPACQPNGGKTPDLSLSRRGFHCFKCGRSGDAVGLAMLADGQDFRAALVWLERRTGIPPPERHQGRRDKEPPLTTRKPEFRNPEPSVAVCLGDSRMKTPFPTPKTPAPVILEAFLRSCRPPPEAALAWLADKIGVTTTAAADLVERLRLRFCGKEYPNAVNALVRQWGEADVIASGLAKRSKAGRVVGTFWHYYAKQTGFLVIPYLCGGRVAYLKARPPCAKDKAESLGLCRFLNTPGEIPCLYNVDALASGPSDVLICEGESDTWAAIARGHAALGSPGARQFKAAWVELFRGFATSGIDEERAAILEFEAGLSIEEAERRAALPEGRRSTVFLALDADKAGDEGACQIAQHFERAGLPAPRRIILPRGVDLCDYFKRKP